MYSRTRRSIFGRRPPRMRAPGAGMGGPWAGSSRASGGADVILGAGTGGCGGTAGMKPVCSMRVEGMTILLFANQTKRPGDHGSAKTLRRSTGENIVHRRGKVELMRVKL